jgi:hypothetical protein
LALQSGTGGKNFEQTYGMQLHEVACEIAEAHDYWGDEYSLGLSVNGERTLYWYSSRVDRSTVSAVLDRLYKAELARVPEEEPEDDQPEPFSCSTAPQLLSNGTWTLALQSGTGGKNFEQTYGMNLSEVACEIAEAHDYWGDEYSLGLSVNGERTLQWSSSRVNRSTVIAVMDRLHRAQVARDSRTGPDAEIDPDAELDPDGASQIAAERAEGQEIQSDAQPLGISEDESGQARVSVGLDSSPDGLTVISALTAGVADESESPAEQVVYGVSNFLGGLAAAALDFADLQFAATNGARPVAEIQNDPSDLSGEQPAQIDQDPCESNPWGAGCTPFDPVECESNPWEPGCGVWERQPTEREITRFQELTEQETTRFQEFLVSTLSNRIGA